MARAPRLAMGKRRLAAGVGDVAAWRIARAMASGVLRGLTDPRWRLVLAVSPGQDVRLRAPGVWPHHGARVRQGQGDLGARIGTAIVAARAHRAGGVHTPVAVVGLDAPDVGRGEVAALFAGLRGRGAASVVLGAAEDGGFWGLALRGAIPLRGLAAVRWSSPHALRDTAQALAGIGAPTGRPRTVAILKIVRADVDTREDWRARGQCARPRRLQSAAPGHGGAR